MTTLQITDRARYMAFVDGFMPSKKSLHNLVLPEFKDDLLKQHISQDEAYVMTLQRMMEEKHGTKFDPNIFADVYLSAPARNPPFRLKYSPINEELIALNDRKDDYRLSFMVVREEVFDNIKEDYFRSVYLATLEELHFEIRPDQSYRNLPRFKNFLHDLSYSIVTKYLPAMQVEESLESLGLDTVS